MVNEEKKTLSPEQFAAWLEWRKWCSVFRVYEPAPTPEELQNGLTDDKSPKERKAYFDYLSQTIHKVLRKRLSFKFTKEQLPEAFWPSPGDSIDCFDKFMKGEKSKKEQFFSGKSYKDYVFYLMAQKQYSPTQVLMGWVLGKNFNSCINTVAARYASDIMPFEQGPRGGILTETYQDPVSGEMHKRRVYKKFLSLDQDTGSDSENHSALYDILGQTESVSDFEIRTFCDTLSREDKLLIIGSRNRCLNHPEFLKLIGWGDEKITKQKNALFKRLKKEIPWDQKDEFSKLLYWAIISDLEAENDTRSFLMNVVNPKEGK
ncbi:MAG: hypothetical protein IKD44_02430 [Lentisphaeria bacterium]|nr:hypothetical protein [Lentisphaeria bacterium]